MSKFQGLLDEYGQSHKNKTNKTIHWICIPLIIFSLIGMLWTIPVPQFMATTALGEWLNWGTIFIAVILVLYFRLSIPIFFGFIILGSLIAIGNHELAAIGNMEHLIISIAIFFLAWVGQFIGHKIEGAKPSFFKDLQFLLIGPAWLMHFLYRKVGLPY